MIGAEALYRLPMSYIDSVRAEYEARRDVAYEELMKIPGVVCKKPGGAFYMSIQLPVESAEDFLMFMLEEFEDNGESMMFTPEAGFYATPGKGINEIRIAYVLCQEDIRRSMELLRLGIEAYKAK